MIYYTYHQLYGSINKNNGVIKEYSPETTKEKRYINGIYLIEDMLVYIIGTYARSGAFAPENMVFCDMNGNVLYQL